jgi:hypothetical protein
VSINTKEYTSDFIDWQQHSLLVREQVRARKPEVRLHLHTAFLDRRRKKRIAWRYQTDSEISGEIACRQIGIDEADQLGPRSQGATNVGTQEAASAVILNPAKDDVAQLAPFLRKEQGLNESGNLLIRTLRVSGAWDLLERRLVDFRARDLP